jgi:hypothetical protein
MKLRVAALVIVVAIPLAFAAKIPNSHVVDSGSFGVYVKGQRVATETFKIEQNATGSTVKSELKAQDGATQRSEMELTAGGEIVHYDWQQIQPSKAHVDVVPKDEFLSETITGGPNEKTFRVPHLLPLSTPILDDNFFLHRELLMWRYLAADCTPKPEGMTCSSTPQQFGVLIPAQHLSATITIDYKDKEKISLRGKEIDCIAFRMTSDNGVWLVYLDDQQKLVRIVAAEAGLEVMRD